MKKFVFVMFVTLGFLQVVSAQQTDSPSGFDKSKLFFGGNFGLNFSSGYSLINVSPQVGYHITDQFAAGFGLNYIHYSYTDYSNFKYSQNYGGLNVFGRFYPIQYLFIQAQPELNYIWGKVRDNSSNEVLYKIPTHFVPSLLLGGGAAIPAGPGAITISILYDVVQDQWSPYYHQAIYAFGYNMGF
jgi:hypothetical protein